MRRSRVLAVLAVFSIAGSACGGGGGSGGNGGDGGTAATAPQAAEEPVRGGTVVAAISADPGHLNPAITTSGPTHTAAEPMYNGLLARDEKGEPVPDLAARWTVEENGAVYRFTLRDGVTWHDGKPFTSADVKFTFEEALLKLHARTKASVAPNLTAIETPDAATVVFRFKQPYAPFLQQLDATEAPIIAKHVYEGTDLTTAPANVQPVGTGPFKFVSYTKGSEVRMARNPAYFRKDLPYLDELVLRVIPDPATQVLAFDNGEVDYLGGVAGPELRRLAADPDVELARTSFNPGGSNCIMTVSFNLDRPALKDVRVRRAIAHAFDRKQFLDQVLFGEGRVAAGPISSGIAFAHKKTSLPSFDRDEAARLLDEAGWKLDGGSRTASGVAGVPDGTKLELDFLHFPTFSKYGDLARQHLSAVGIDLALKPLEPPVFATTVFTDRDFDTNVISYCNGPDPEIGVRRMFDSSQIGAVPFTNAAAYRNATVDRLFAEAGRTVDRAKRSAAYGKISDIVSDELPYVWLVETESTRAWQADCDGFRPYAGNFAEAAYCRR